MKKIVLVVLLVGAMVMMLAGCNNSVTPSTAWADEEVLEYNVLNSKSEEIVGNMKITTVRSPADKTLDGETYSSADGKMTMDVVIDGKYTVHTEILTARYNVLATHKEYTDLTDGSKSYVLKAYHSGKNYIYTLNDGGEKKLKVGSSGYTDSEYVYHYIRSYPLSSPPSSIKVADPKSGTVLTVGCTAYASKAMTLPYPNGSKNADCTVIAISLASEPMGEPIYVFYTPDSEDYYMSGLSISPSKKMPVKIIENDLTYVVTSMSVK